MYKKANRFMIGSRKGSGYSGRGATSESKGTVTKLRKKTQAIAREYQKILAKKKANELRILKEQQRAIAEKKARIALRDAITASIAEHRRLRAEPMMAAVTSPKLDKGASKHRNASRKELVVVKRRDGRETKSRTGLAGKAKPAPRPHKKSRSPTADSGKPLIEYKFVPSGEHLQIETRWAGRHPKEAIDHAKASLERYARSQYDEIRIFSKKYMGRAYFHVSGMQQMIDWQPAGAPPRNSHGGEVRARGIDSMARRGVSFKK